MIRRWAVQALVPRSDETASHNTNDRVRGSAITRLNDVHGRKPDDRTWPKAEGRLLSRHRENLPFGIPPQTCRSFDHVVGSQQQRFRDFNAECLVRLEVHHQLKFGRLFNR
jgi:hypothetical protein